MTSRYVLAAWLLAALGALAAPSGARADDGDEAPSEHLLSYHLADTAFALELSMGAAFAHTTQAPHVVTSEGEPIGPLVAGTAILRLGYFISPFIDVAYYGLGATTDTTRSDGETVVVRGALSLLGIGGGVMLDVWYFRLRAGLIMNELRASSRIDGVDASSARLSLGYLFGLAGFFYRRDRLQLGLESRLAIDSVHSVMAMTIGLVGTLDLFR